MIWYGFIFWMCMDMYMTVHSTNGAMDAVSRYSFPSRSTSEFGWGQLVLIVDKLIIDSCLLEWAALESNVNLYPKSCFRFLSWGMSEIFLRTMIFLVVTKCSVIRLGMKQIDQYQIEGAWPKIFGACWGCPLTSHQHFPSWVVGCLLSDLTFCSGGIGVFVWFVAFMKIL